MKRRRRSKRRQTIDVGWAIAVGVLAAGGVVACAHYQENLHSGGMRLAMIAAAISLGAGAGLLADRMTASRRSARRSGPNRKTRRQMRSVAFAVTGIVIASSILALYMAHQVHIILGTAAFVLAATWLWYILESRHLARGTEALRLRNRNDD
ncbi:MAG: hypothetical protein R6V07_13480 [Armatimonadota bacterium]